MAPRLIVTVDNGIASHDGVAAAAARGIEVLITDHHLPAATLPAPALIVNPNQPGCDFPGKNLAGVGVMFYVLLATRALLRAARPLRGPRGTESRRAARSRRAGHRRRRRVSRPDQPDARRAGARAHPRRSRAAGRRGAARGRRAAILVARRPTTSGSSPARGSMPRAGSSDMAIGIRCLLAETPVIGGAARRDARPAQSRTPRRGGVDARRRRSRRSKRAPSTRSMPTPTRFACSTRRLASGRGRYRRRPAQGPLSPPGDRLRARQRRRAQGFGAIDRRLPPARRAGPRRQARAGPADEIRRPRLRRGPDAGRVRPAPVRRALRGDRPRAAVGRRSRAHARIRRDRLRRASSASISPAPCATRSGARASLPRCSTTRSRCSTSGSSGAQHSKLALARGARALRRDPLSHMRAAPAVDSGRLSPGRQRMARRGDAAARHRALAAGLPFVDPPGDDPPQPQDLHASRPPSSTSSVRPA